jgi:periplasmic protein TonB
LIAMSDLDTEQGSSRRLWIFAGLAALALHLGGAALAVAHLRTDDADDSLGAQAIEIGLEMTSPHLQPTDLPPGPDTEASVASPAVAEQKAELKESELPKDVPTETEDPDRVVTPNDSHKPKEEDAKVAAVQATASTESVAAEATAAPDLQSSLSDKATAPTPGIGKSAEFAKATWDKKLSVLFKKNLRFPEGAKTKGAHVQVLLEVEFDRLGHVVLASIVEGSGQKPFDEAALKMVRRSDPVPVPPPLVADQGLKRIVPVVFNDPN